MTTRQEYNCAGFNLRPSVTLVEGGDISTFALHFSQETWERIHDLKEKEAERIFRGKSLHPIFPRENGSWGFGASWRVNTDEYGDKVLTPNHFAADIDHDPVRYAESQYETLRILYNLLETDNDRDGTRFVFGPLDSNREVRVEVTLGTNHFLRLTDELSDKRIILAQCAMSSYWEGQTGEYISPECYIIGAHQLGSGLNTLAKDDVGKYEIAFRIPSSLEASLHPNQEIGSRCNHFVLFSHRRYGNPLRLLPDFGMPTVKPLLVFTMLTGLASL